jgi:hypothetical protein
MGQIRQPFAILLFYTFLPIAINRKILFVGIVIFLGILFHKSLFFSLPVLFFINKKLSINNMYIILALSIVFNIYSHTIVYWFYSFIPNSFYLKDTIDMYLFAEHLAIGRFFSLGMLERIFMLFIIIYFCNKYNILHHHPYAQQLFNLYLLGICLYFAIIPVSADFAGRGTQTMNYALFFLYPIIFSYAKYREKIFLLVVLTCWSIYLSSKILFDDTHFIPYHSILF